MGKTRVFNDHPTQAFVGHWHGAVIIHQPKGKTFELTHKRVSNPNSSRKYSLQPELVEVGGKSVNWVDVPEDYAKKVTQDGLGMGRLQPNRNESTNEVDMYHHGGHLKTQDVKDREHENEYKARQQELAELTKKIEEQRQILAAAERSAQESADDAEKKKKAKDKV